MSDTSKSTFDAAVDVAAMIGEWSAIISLIGACVIGFFLVIIGIVLMAKGKAGAGLILIVMTAIMIGLSYFYYYIVTSHKGIAAIAGVATVVDVVNGGGLQHKKQHFQK